MASSIVHAVEYLSAPDKYAPRPVCAVFGDEPFLRRQSIIRLREAVLGGGDAEYSLATFDGPQAELRDVLDELATVAMFSGQRLVVVHEADDFVSRWRAELEAYVAAPAATGVLVLELRALPANTRLYKALAADGLLVECGAPSGAALGRWLGTWARQTHGVELPMAAAEVLVEMVGPELGLLDQELAKLALTVESGQKITAEAVSRSVGGWRARTTWEMLDAALSGEAAGAMRQLDRLLAAGEAPIGLLGQISASLRRLAAATRLVLQGEAAGRRIPLKTALEEAGVRTFALQKAERQLRHLGRRRGAELYGWLLEADLDLKGASALPPRLVIERLILRLAAQQQPAETGR